MAELIVEKLTRTFGDVVAVKDVSFKVAEGEFLTLLGPSGCGKSTTLSAIAGLERATSGRICVGGEVYFDGATGRYLPPERRRCGMVFQSYALWPHMTVAGNCAYPLKLRKVDAAERKRRIAETLALVEMDHLAERYPHELSGGQQQRVALARTLVFRPDILLLDEPLSNLDAKLRERARIWLKHLQAQTGLTTVYVTHDQIEALAMSDRIAVMEGGRIVQLDTPRRIWNGPVSRFVADFIGSSNLIEATLEAAGEPARIRCADGQLVLASVAAGATTGMTTGATMGATTGITTGATGATGGAAPADALATAAGSTATLSEGPVVLAVRPERIQLAPASEATTLPDDGTVSRITGNVVERTFLGARFAYGVRTLNTTLRVESDRELPDDNVVLGVPHDAVVVFRAG